MFVRWLLRGLHKHLDTHLMHDLVAERENGVRDGDRGRLDGSAGQEGEGVDWVDEVGRGVGVRDIPNKPAADVEVGRDGTAIVLGEVHVTLGDVAATGVVGAGAGARAGDRHLGVEWKVC